MSDRTTDRDRQAGDRTVLSVPQAAERLGITPDAVRSRLHRGTLAGEKRSGAWRVFFPPVEPTGARQDATGTKQDTDSTAPDALIARLEAENAYLRQILDAEIEARRRADHLVAGLVERVRELPATVDVTDVLQESNPAPLRDDTAARASEPYTPVSDTLALAWRRWWRRMTGGG